MTEPPRPATERARAELVARLAECAFDEARCARRLGLASARRFVQRVQAWKVVGARAQHRPTTGPEADALDLLIALFLFGQPVPRGAVAGVLGEAAAAAVTECGLARPEGDELRAGVMLFPCRGLHLATDRLDADRALNPVMPLFPESYDLGALAVRAPVEGALDLCTGSGIHALLAARHAGVAAGVDISPRAAAFARFNAWLNGIDNTEWLLGDVYAPLPEGRTFGLITANPPYNPELDSAAGDDYHSGGESGEEVLARIVAGVPRRLDAEGHAQIITLLIHRQDDPLEERLRRWLREGDPGAAFDIVLMARDVDYRPLVLKGGKLSPAEQALHESWQRQRITRFQFGVINLRRSPPGRAPRTVHAPFGDHDGPEGFDVQAAFAGLA